MTRRVRLAASLLLAPVAGRAPPPAMPAQDGGACRWMPGHFPE